MIDGGPVYTVKTLLAARKRGRGRQLLVDWKGYGPEERSWIPSRFIIDKSLIEDFDRLNSEEPGPSGAVPRRGGTVMSKKLIVKVYSLC